MQWFEEVAEYLEPETVYTHKELVAFIKTHYPYVSQGSYHWGINSMMKCGKLARIGYDQYRKADGTEREYTPNYTKSTQTLVKRIARKYPDIAFTTSTSSFSMRISCGFPYFIGDSEIRFVITMHPDRRYTSKSFLDGLNKR